jgi:hypothetical protein
MAFTLSAEIRDAAFYQISKSLRNIKRRTPEESYVVLSIITSSRWRTRRIPAHDLAGFKAPVQFNKKNLSHRHVKSQKETIRGLPVWFRRTDEARRALKRSSHSSIGLASIRAILSGCVCQDHVDLGTSLALRILASRQVSTEAVAIVFNSEGGNALGGCKPPN